METIGQALPDRIQQLIERNRESLRNTTIFKEMLQFYGVTEDELLGEYGKYESAYKTITECSKCTGLENCTMEPRGYGYNIINHSGYIQLSMFQCEKQIAFEKLWKIQRLLESSRLPELFHTKTFATLKIEDGIQEAYQAAIEFCDDEREKGFVFAGPPGVGKTHLAAAVMNDQLNKGRECIFCTVPELLADIRKAMRSDKETTELIELVKGTSLLILDDLGAEKTTDWVAEQLFVILNARLVRMKDTFITTNYQKPSELIEKLGGGLTGQRIVSRIRELCNWVNLTGSDWRLK